MAERVGFEPTVGYKPTPIFKTGALNQLDHLSIKLLASSLTVYILTFSRPNVNSKLLEIFNLLHEMFLLNLLPCQLPFVPLVRLYSLIFLLLLVLHIC